MQAWMDGEAVWPYQRIIDDWGGAFEDWRKQMSRHLAKITAGEPSTFIEHNSNLQMALFAVRDEYVARFGFAIPCAELLDALAQHGPIVEIGAGSGYMTRLMRLRGIDVIGTDIDIHTEDSHGHGFIVGEHDPHQIGRASGKQAVRRFPERTVFCSWPTYRATWFRQALRAMRRGQKLIMIREDCIADETAYQYLDDCFDELGTVDLPVFPYIHDYAAIYVKRRQNAQGSPTRSPMLGRHRSVSRRARAKNSR
jgi:hypothetical protein